MTLYALVRIAETWLGMTGNSWPNCGKIIMITFMVQRCDHIFLNEKMTLYALVRTAETLGMTATEHHHWSMVQEIMM